MPNQGPELSDPDEWLDNFTSSLNGIGNLTGSSTPPSLPSVPGLLGSRDDLDVIASSVNSGSDPTASITASAARSIPGAPAPLPYHPVPSPHAGHYASLDEAAKAAASDVPKNPYWEYGAYLPQRYVTDTIDLGDGFGPQNISHVDGYDYGGLYTSENPDKITLGLPPSHLGGWFHNHPWDSVFNEQNLEPSPQRGGDWDFIDRLHTNNPAMQSYILGPDGQLRRFWLRSDRGRIIK